MNRCHGAVSTSTTDPAFQAGQQPGLAAHAPVPAPVVHEASASPESAVALTRPPGSPEGSRAPAASKPSYRFVPDGLTPLAHAACTGNVDQLMFLIAQGADVNAREKRQGYGQGYTPLVLAAKNGHARVIDALLKAGADANRIGRSTCGSALICAAECGHGDVVALLLRQAGIRPNETKFGGATAFCCAALNGHAAIAEALLPVTNVPPAVRNELMVSACRGGKKAVMELLHQRGGMGREALDASCCLHAAASAGKADIVAYLLRAGVAADAAGMGDMTPLQHACMNGHLAVVEVLLGHPDIAIGNPIPAKTPPLLYLAAFDGHLAVVEFLLRAGAPPNLKDDRTGRTALMAAADRGRIDIMRALLAHPDLKFDLVCNAGWSALGLAMLSKQRDAAICLLKAGATVAFPGKSSYSSSLLCWSIDLRDIDLCRLVLERGHTVATPAAVPWDDVLMHAVQAHCAGVVECLLEAGAGHPELADKYRFVLPRQSLLGTSYSGSLRRLLEAHAARASAMAAGQPVAARQRHDVMVDDFDYYGDDIAIADLQRSYKAAAALWPTTTATASKSSTASDAQLALFNQLLAPLASSTDAIDGARDALLSSLYRKRLFLSVALPVSDCLIGRGKGLAVLAGPGGIANAQQRAIYYAAALSTLKPVEEAATAIRLYELAGVSGDGVKRLGSAVRQQFNDLLDLVDQAAALLGAEMIEQILPACLKHTDNRYQVDGGELAAKLVAAGMIRPLAHAVAESWRVAVEALKSMPLSMPQGVTFIQAARIMDDAINRLTRPQFSASLLARLEGLHLLTEFRSMTSDTETDDALHMLFQIQVDQLRQYCTQLNHG